MSELLDLVTPYLKKVKTSGPENIMAICPFHRKAGGQEERNGSFSMNKYNGLWYCHSCHASGTIWTFLREVGMSNVTIKDHADLIERVTRTMPKRREALKPVEPTSGLYLEESFLGLFDTIPQEILDSPDYLAGFAPELLRRFDIGFDKEHQRITFPLRDLEGRLIGISGRSLGRGARYKIYDKEYEVWGLPARATEKRVVIWNSHHVASKIAMTTDESEKYVAIVEGFKGCMRLLQAGVDNTIAILGSDPTEEQVDWIRGLDVPVYLMFDNDAAGFMGTMKAGNAIPRGLHSVDVVQYDTKQPSDLKPSEVIDAFLTTTPFVQWFAKAILDQHTYLTQS